jgi:hypothetical protein
VHICTVGRGLLPETTPYLGVRPTVCVHPACGGGSGGGPDLVHAAHGVRPRLDNVASGSGSAGVVQALVLDLDGCVVAAV